MKLVMTLRARDEADVLESQISYHLAAGVDFFVAIDHRSTDGTTEILESHARQGHVHVIREEDEEMREGEWATRMARVAAREFGADWVISSDADEFWWPRGESLKDVLESIPARYGIVRALLRHFVPRPDDGTPFAERLVIRTSTSAPINDPTSLFRPNLKSIHRADPDVTLASGAHTLVGSGLMPLRGWYPIELLHFPIRSFDQFDRKYTHLGTSLRTGRNAYYEEVHRARGEGTLDAYYESLVVDDSSLERGLSEGSLVVDTRVRDALRAIHEGKKPTFTRPSVVDEAAYAVDVAALGEADVVRLQRRLDTLEHRLVTLEHRPLVRVDRRLRAVAKKLLHRNSARRV
jgi:Glycosyl transferase family 2